MADHASGVVRAPLMRMFKGTTGMVFILLCLMYFIEYVDRANLSVAAPLIKKELSLSNTQLGWILGAFGWCYAAFQLIGGFAGDRFGARTTLAVLGMLWAIGTLMTGFAGGVAGLVVARLLVGMGEAGTLPTSARVISAWVPVARRGFAQGFTHSAARFAAAMTPLIFGLFLIPMAGWRTAFIVMGFASMVWIAVWLLYFRNDPREHAGVKPHELAILPAYAPHGQKLTGVPWGRLIKRTIPVTLVFFCHAWTLWLYLTWLPSFFADTYHLDLKKTALFSTGVFLAGMVGDTVGGLITDAIYQRTGDIVKARRNTVVLGFTGSFVCLLGVVFFHDQTAVTVSLALALFFLEVTEAPIWAVPTDIAPKYVGFASGIMATAAGFAATISPIAFGIVTDLTGSQRLPFLMSIGLLIVGVGLAYTMRPDLKVDSPEDEAETNRLRAVR